jgi:RimJ/RimL family protein N-acetyltransferase
VELTEVTAELRDRVLALEPEPEQRPFSSAAALTLPAAEAHPDRRAVVGLDAGEPVAFFVLDTGRSMPVHAPDIVGVRAFYVDRRHQRRGLGTAVLRALPAFVRTRYPQARRVALTVNAGNEPARRVYARAGFADTGRVYGGGPHGPQHVLELELG